MAEENKPAPVPAEPTPAAAAPASAAEGGAEELNPDGTPLSDNQKKKRAKAAEAARVKAEKAAKLAADKAAREASEVDFAAQYYGALPLNMSQERTGAKRTALSEINAGRAGESVLVSARVMTTRSPSAKLCFLTLRKGFDCIQTVVTQAPEKVSKQMVKWVSTLSAETIVLVQGTIVAVEKPVESSTITVRDAELKIERIHSVSPVTWEGQLPFNVDEATRSAAEIEASQSTERKLPSVALDTRLDNRVLDLRTTTNQAIFRLTHAVSKLFREFLDANDFIEIHTPKLGAAATESGASVFKVGYFDTQAFLAQSPQLAKQMAIAADFPRVYEVGPVFRAENSNTHRHMTEFTGLDLEMAFEEHYHEVVDMLDGLFTFIFRELPKRYKREIETVKRQFDCEEFLLPEKTVKLQYREGIQLLRDAGVEIGDYDDMNTEQERTLGRIVREKYKTDFFMLDKFPLEIRPFYTMPDPNDKRYSNSYDFFMRGQEILSGAQRVHDAKFLEERMRGMEPPIPVESMKHYVDAFRLAAPPHAGGGIGLERVVMFYLDLGNIRRASMFPRDPKRLEP